MEAHVVLTRGLKERERAYEVGLDERRRILERVVVVGLGGEVDDDVILLRQLLDERGVRDVAVDELDVFEPRKVRAVARVRELVEDGDFDFVTRSGDEADEVGADEAGAAGNEHAVHGCPS